MVCGRGKGRGRRRRGGEGGGGEREQEEEKGEGRGRGKGGRKRGGEGEREKKRGGDGEGSRGGGEERGEGRGEGGGGEIEEVGRRRVRRGDCYVHVSFMHHKLQMSKCQKGHIAISPPRTPSHCGCDHLVVLTLCSPGLIVAIETNTVRETSR